MGDSTLPFGRGDCSSTVSKQTLLFASCLCHGRRCYSRRIPLSWLDNLHRPSFTSGAVLLSGYGVAGFLDGIIEVLGAHPGLVIGDLDSALLDICLRVLYPGEFVQFVLDSSLAVSAAHVRHLQRLLGYHLSLPFDDVS